MKNSLQLILVSLYLICLLLTCRSNAIVIRHDKPDSDYQQYAVKFAPYLAHLDRCTATVINDYWLVTAAHCVNPNEQYPLKIQHLENDYPVYKIIQHPDFKKKGEPDLALLQLRWPLKNAKSAPFYKARDELGKSIMLAGKGTTGDGISGDSIQDGVLRAATNTINDVDENWLVFTFNQAQEATDLEGVSGSGDSGGPAFILQSNIPFLAGVSCCQEAERQGSYGAIENYARVSTHINWLENHFLTTPPKKTVEDPILSLLANGEISAALSLIHSDTNWQKSPQVTEELLTYAFISKNLALLKAIVSTSPQVLKGDLQGLPLLDYALKQNNGEFFIYLVDAGVDLSHRGFRGQQYLSRLMWQYLNYDVTQLATKLLQAGLDINQQDDRGDSALHLAGFNGELSRVKFLVEHGADINLKDNNGNTLLMDAKRRRQADIVTYLLSKGAKIN